MSRLPSEWQRLYGLPPADASDPASDGMRLIDAQGRVRAMVLALARPADWAALSTVWQAVQADLGLPAPGIAVSGVDAFQLWFSLAQPVPLAEAHGFLDALRQRHLAHIAPSRTALLPLADADASQQAWSATPRPGGQALADQWAAFVAPDLAPMFTDTPWLDLPPNPEGQAELLAGLRSIKPAEWQAALERLRPAPAPALAPATADTAPSRAPAAPRPDAAQLDAQRFLSQVMNDEAVPLALRIEAAKALLTGTLPR